MGLILKRGVRYGLFGMGFLLFVLLFFMPAETWAQCSMCTLNAEQSVQGENTQGKGLNDGILYLLAMPYIAIAALGFLWYKKYKKKAEHKDPISLN